MADATALALAHIGEDPRRKLGGGLRRREDDIRMASLEGEGGSGEFGALSLVEIGGELKAHRQMRERVGLQSVDKTTEGSRTVDAVAKPGGDSLRQLREESSGNAQAGSQMKRKGSIDIARAVAEEHSIPLLAEADGIEPPSLGHERDRSLILFAEMAVCILFERHISAQRR